MATNLQQTLSNPKYCNWVKSGLVLKFTKDGIQHFVDAEVKRFHQQILAKCGPAATNCTNCMTKNVPPTRNMTCQKGICDKFRNNITNSHRYRKKNSNHEGPSWRNTDAQHWCSNSWEVAKCYMAASGYSNASSAVDTDLPGLLSVIINLTDFGSAVTENLSVNTNIFCKARNIRNDILHTSTFEVTDNELNGYIATMIQLLSDSKRLAADPNAIDAIAELIKIQNGTLVVTDEHERQLRALKAISDEEEKAVQNIQTAASDQMTNIQTEGKEQIQKFKQSASDQRDGDLQTIKAEGNKQTETVAKIGSEQVESIEKAVEKGKAELKQTNIQHEADRENADTQKMQEDLRTNLIELYQTDYIKVSLQPLNPDDTDTDVSDIYVEPCMKSVGPNGERSPVTSDKDIFYKDIFYKDGLPCKKIYITGDALMGKTILCLKMIETWCKVHSNPTKSNDLSGNEKVMLEFKFLFYISLRHALSNSKINEMISKQLVQKECFATLLSTMPESETCLIILDGLDEWEPPKNHESIPAVNKGLPGRPSVTKWTIVTTTRSWKLEVLRLNQAEIDQQIEIMGLNEESSDEFIDKDIYILNKKRESDKSASKFKKELREKNLGHVCTIPPGLLKQLICLWYDGKPLGKSQCDSYSNMIELLFELAVNSEKISLGEQCTEEPKQLPKCFHNKTYCEQYKDLVMSLSRLAFKALFSDTGSYLVFESKKIGSYGLSEYQMNNCLKVGFLSKSKVSTDLSSKTASLTFIYKTFQEFLAAVFISMTSDSLNTISNICKSVDKVFEMSNVFVYVSGMCPETTYKLSELISDVSSSEKQEYRSRAHSHYKLDQIQEFIINCIEEGRKNGHEGFKLKLEDIIIGNPTVYRRYTFSLMNLLHDNIQSHIHWDHVVSLNVTVSSEDESIKLSELLKHVDSPLQILIIKSKLVKTSTDTIYTVLCKGRDSLCKLHLSIGHIEDNVKDRLDFSELSTKQLSTMMPGVKHITDLKLECIILTKEQLCWLLDYISRATQLTHIVVKQCTTSELVPFEGSSENICNKRILGSQINSELFRYEICIYPHNRLPLSLDLSNHDKLKKVFIDPHLATVDNTKLDSLETFTMKLSPQAFESFKSRVHGLYLEDIKASSTQYSCLILIHSDGDNKLVCCECPMYDTPENIEIRLPDDISQYGDKLSIKGCFGDIGLILPTEMSHFFTVYIEDLTMTRPSILSSISDMPSVNQLHLTRIKFCVEGHELPVMKNLQSFVMNNVEIKGDALQYLMSSAPNLKILNLNAMQFDYPDDECGEHVLPMLKNLQSFVMNNVEIKGNSLQYLMSSTPNLEILDLNAMQFDYPDDECGEHELPMLKNLQSVKMESVEIKGDALQYLMSSAPNLKILNLYAMQFDYPDDECGEHVLPMLKNLQSFVMNNVEIKGNSLQYLMSSAPNLEILDLNEMQFDYPEDECGKHVLPMLKNLQSVKMESVRIKGDALQYLMSIAPNLKQMQFNDMPLEYHVAEHEMSLLPIELNLKYIQMHEVEITVEALHCLMSSIPHVETLQLENVHLEYPEDEGEIRSLPRMRNIEFSEEGEVQLLPGNKISEFVDVSISDKALNSDTNCLPLRLQNCDPDFFKDKKLQVASLFNNLDSIEMKDSPMEILFTVTSMVQGITRLRLENCSVELYRFMSSIPTIKSLETRHLDLDYNVDEGEKQSLPLLPNLESLEMCDDSMTGNVFICFIGSAPNIKTLKLIRTAFMVDLYRFMSCIPNITTLDMRSVDLDCNVGEGEIQPLPLLPHLETLKMYNFKLVDKVLHCFIDSAPNIKTLKLGYQYIPLFYHHGLHLSVELYRFMNCISNITTLKMSFVHADYNVAEGEKQSLPLLPNLESLEMCEVIMTDKVLNCFIGSAPNIKTLKLEYMKSSVDLYRFMSCIPIITTLGMRSMHLDYNVAEGEIQSLPLLPNLESLEMCQVIMTDKVLNCFIGSAPNIKTLKLEHRNINSTEGFQSLSDVKFLESVTISLCTISSTGLRCFVDNLAHVQTPVEVKFEHVYCTTEQEKQKVMDYFRSHPKYVVSQYSHERGTFSFHALRR